LWIGLQQCRQRLLAQFGLGAGRGHGRIVGERLEVAPYNGQNSAKKQCKGKHMAIYQLDELAPKMHATAWVAENAQVMGNVALAEDSSVWFGVVIRGDTETISVGKGSNIQDNSVLHADHGMPLVIGENVTVGHQVMLHGCTIGDGSLIGIQAVVLNGAKIGKNCLVGAGSLVTEGKEFPDGSMILGSPAKVVRQLTPEQMEGLKMSAQHYVENARRYKTGLKKID
jgi:carbonic anhydrase/acetyltransferase-like protein (isoleucine patch superfamily)